MANVSYKQGKQPSGSSPSFLCCSTWIRPPFLPCLNAFRLALSLSLLPQHSDILTFYGIMSKIGEPKVRFLSLSSLQTTRSGLLLAESALFTLPSLLFAADEGGTPARHCFFFLSAFCHLANFFHSLSSSSARSLGPAEPFRGLQRVAAALHQRPRRSTPHRFSAASSSWSSPRFDAKPPLNVGVAAKSKFQQRRDRLSSFSYSKD